jgi:hypothetical protein
MIEWLKKERLHDKTPKQDVKSKIKRCNKHLILIRLYITSSTFLILLKKLCATLITALSIGAKERVFIWHKRWLNSDKKLDNGWNCIGGTMDDVHFVLDQHAQLDLYSARSLKKQVSGKTCRFTRTHYSDSELTSFCSFSFMLRA